MQPEPVPTSATVLIDLFARMVVKVWSINNSVSGLGISTFLLILNLSEVGNMISAELSEGMKKRLDIACSIIHRPKVLILDEPTANLDFRLRDELLDYAKQVNKYGMTIIFVSHYLDEVEVISDRIAILSNSYMEIVQNNGNLKELFKMRMN